jgi:hypothetical protein
MWLMVVGDQGALDWRADHPVVPDAGVEREQPLHDPGPQPGGDPAAVAFGAELVLQGPDDRLDPLPQPVREGPGVFSSLRAGRISARPRSGSAKKSSVSWPARPLSVTMAVPGAGRLAGWRSSICRAWSRSPKSLGLARANPVTVPSQVQISSSLAPRYRREWLGQ